MKIPTQKGQHSSKCRELPLKQRGNWVFFQNKQNICCSAPKHSRSVWGLFNMYLCFSCRREDHRSACGVTYFYYSLEYKEASTGICMWRQKWTRSR